MPRLRHFEALDALKLGHDVIHASALGIPVDRPAVQGRPYEDVTLLLHLSIQPGLQVTTVLVDHRHLIII